MSQWQWARTVDRTGIARYVVPKWAARVANLTLAESAYDLSASQAGRRRLAQQIYEGLLGWAEQNKRISYDRPEYTYERELQAIRTPEEILVSPRQGTCLDLSLLYAGLCLHYGLLPLLVLLDGHAYVALDLTHSRTHDETSGWEAFGRKELVAIEQGEGLLTDAALAARLVEPGHYLPVECTGFAYSQKLPPSLPEGQGRFMGYLPFEQAVAAGQAQLSHTERPFRYAAAIHYLHQKGVRPLEPGEEQPSPSERPPSQGIQIMATDQASIDISGNVAGGNISSITKSGRSPGGSGDQNDPSETEAEIETLRELINSKSRRKSYLQLQAARTGYNTDPEILMEIEDLEEELKNLNAELKRKA